MLLEAIDLIVFPGKSKVEAVVDGEERSLHFVISTLPLSHPFNFTYIDKKNPLLRLARDTEPILYCRAGFFFVGGTFCGFVFCGGDFLWGFLGGGGGGAVV